MRNQILKGCCVALSISDSPDMDVLGMRPEHLEDAMIEIARHLIACGATLAYGGDFRDRGFTELLFEVVNRYRLNEESENILVHNYLASPVHRTMSSEALEGRVADLEGMARLILLMQDGTEITVEGRGSQSSPPTDQEWSVGLTAMRMVMASNTQARIALGGRTTGFRGRLPGIAEEALIQLERKAPLFILGGFGGCSFDIVRAMGLSTQDVPRETTAVAWAGLDEFRMVGASDLHNGLSASENKTLAETVHVDQAVSLILRGLIGLRRRRLLHAPSEKP